MSSGPSRPGDDEVEDRPDLAEAVLDGRAAERQPPVGPEALGGARRGAQRVLDLLRLVDDDVAPVDLLEHLLVAAEERVARHDHVGVLELVLPLPALGAVPERVAQRRGEAVHLAQPVGHDARRRHDERLEGLALALDLRVLGLHGEQQRERLHGLAEAHVVGENAAAADLVEKPEPVKALLLVRPELRLEVARLARALDLVDVLELLEELLRVAGDARPAHLGQQVLDATGLRQGQPPAVAAARRQDLGLALQHLADLLRVDARERPVGQAHVLAAVGEAPRQLVLRDGDSLALEVEAQGEPVDAAADARVRRQRLVAHVHVDEIVGHEDVPLIGQRRDALGPEADRVVAAGDELVAVFVGHEAQIAQLRRGRLLRGDVAPDALGPLDASRARCSPARRRRACGQTRGRSAPAAP